MGMFKHFLLIVTVLTYTALGSVMAQDEDIIPETDESPIASVPQLNNGNPTPPVIIDESDSSGVSETEDYDN